MLKNLIVKASCLDRKSLVVTLEVGSSLSLIIEWDKEKWMFGDRRRETPLTDDEISLSSETVFLGERFQTNLVIRNYQQQQQSIVWPTPAQYCHHYFLNKYLGHLLGLYWISFIVTCLEQQLMRHDLKAVCLLQILLFGYKQDYLRPEIFPVDRI